MDKVQRFIACFLTGSFAWGLIPAAWALADVAVDTSVDANVSAGSSSEASVTTETQTETSAGSGHTSVQSSHESSVSAETGTNATVQLNLGQRIKVRCHRLNGRDRERCVHEVMGNVHAKAESRFAQWMQNMRDRMEKHREQFEAREEKREEKMEDKLEKTQRKSTRLSPEVRARIRAEHKLQVEAARSTCSVKETFQEEHACMAVARIELRAKLKAMIEAALGQE